MDQQSRLLFERNVYRSALELSPYNANLYLQRAICYEGLGYPDLAAGDAYRALLLTDEIVDESAEFHEQALEALKIAERENKLTGAGIETFTNLSFHDSSRISLRRELMEGEGASEDKHHQMEESSWCEVIAREYASRSYEILARTLLECGDVRNAFKFTERGLKICLGHNHLWELQRRIVEKNRQRQVQKNAAWVQTDFNPKTDLSGHGFARRELYPWNDHEPDRFSESSITFVSAEIRKIAPKCEVRAVNLPDLRSTCNSNTSQSACHTTHVPQSKQLGIFTTESIAPGETILLEPSVLTANNRHRDPLCDACSSPLPPMSCSSSLPTCQSCDDIVFCSQACLDRAQELYHPAICGIEDFDVVAKDPAPTAATDALYFLLVARVMAMSETQDLHPLDLPQTKYLWGDFSPSPSLAERNLPFNFQTNIANPIHVLTNMGLDPFAPSTLARYDTWILNNLFAKFRGTANAKMNERCLRPDVAGAHWKWSLANHSCGPNAMWDWGGGGMGFVARDDDDVVQWGAERKRGGLEKGEEVLNHYCDIRLPVQERREWAIGALGGMCVCERCLWEQREEEPRR